MGKQKAKDLRLSIRITGQEKKLLEVTAQQFDMCINDYIKHKLLDSNQDLKSDEFCYEVAPGSKHDYVTVGAEYFNHYLILELIKKLCPKEEASLYDNAHKRAAAKINSLGYHKHSNKDGKRETINA